MKVMISLAFFAILTTLVHSQSTSGGSGITCNGECVPFYQCKNNTVITDGEGLIDLRFRGPCDTYIEVCCESTDVSPGPITPPPVVKRQGCGIRYPEGFGFKTTGDVNNESKYGEFPWMVAILSKQPTAGNKETYICGGSLIHPSVVLTAAHCVANKKADEIKIRAGEWDSQTEKEIYPHQDRDVNEIRTHIDFYSGGLFHDIAVMFLTSPVNLVDNVGLACLAAQDETFDNSRCFTTGWGKNVFGKAGTYQVILKKVELPVVPRGKCQTSLRKTKLGGEFELHYTFLCAGGEAGKDSCTGDGGSPLVCPLKSDPTRYVQAGIVAWGIGCGENNVPGVYANLGKLRSWVDEEIMYQGLDRKVYQP